MIQTTKQMIEEKRNNKRWTFQEDEILTTMTSEGKCAPEISERLRRSTNAIYSRKCFLGLHDIRIQPATGDYRQVKAGDTILNIEVPFTAQVGIIKALVGSFIGPKGSHISSVALRFGVSVRVDTTAAGEVIAIRGNSREDVEACRAYVEDLVKLPQVGEVFTGRVASVTSYGAFISIKEIHHGLCHASQIKGEPINAVSDYLTEGDEVRVEVISMNGHKPALSMSTPLLKGEEAITTVNVIESDPEVVAVMSPREITTEMTRLARQLARSNGQRMVLAVYFVDSGKE